MTTEFKPTLLRSDDPATILFIDTALSGISGANEFFFEFLDTPEYEGGVIDWGDGFFTIIDSANFTTLNGSAGILHTYATGGTYTVRLGKAFRPLKGGMQDWNKVLNILKVGVYGENGFADLQNVCLTLDNNYSLVVDGKILTFNRTLNK